MSLKDQKNLFSGRPNFRLTDDQRVYAFLYANIYYQELRPKFCKEIDTIKEIIRLLAEDPACPIPDLSLITIRRILATTRGRREPGQWHFKRTINPINGEETGSVSVGRRFKYLHPSHWAKTHTV
jgi:hypothetical protein